VTETPKLTHSFLTADGSKPERWLVFLHGILGSGANWRSFARRVVNAHPSWGATLVDLRAHGGSQGFPPPHGVREAASDLDALTSEMPGVVAGVVGHSFGGKVALAYVETNPSLEAAFILDSNPGPRPTFRGSESTVDTVAMLRELDRPWPSRKDFVAEVVRRHHAAPFAEWLAQNLVHRGDELVLRLDMDVIDALLADYFAIDLWPVVESSAARLSFVVGGRSTVLDDGDRARLASLAESTRGRVSLDVLPSAGHWVHTDDPDGLFAVISRSM
jgi:pimeloyl-ACP methyl ester carboxylesterase